MTAGFVYLLENDNGDRYVGSTNDIDRRLQEHKRKHLNSKYTASKNNLKLKYYKEFPNIKEARDYERLIKRNKKYRNIFYEESHLGLPV